MIDQLGFSNLLSTSEYITIDEIEKTNDLPNEEEIISIIVPNEQVQVQEEIGEEDPSVSNKEALLAIENLNLYIKQQYDLQLSNDY